jgi:hypothetical protein
VESFDGEEIRECLIALNMNKQKLVKVSFKDEVGEKSLVSGILLCGLLSVHGSDFMV